MESGGPWGREGAGPGGLRTGDYNPSFTLGSWKILCSGIRGEGFTVEVPAHALILKPLV